MIGNKVAVIGGAGFLGSHLVGYLLTQDCQVVVLDNLLSGKREFVPSGAKFIWCDITHSEAELRRIFEDEGIEYVFNYAAAPYVPDSYERPLNVFDINARGAAMVINAAQDAHVEGILQVSSAEIYGDLEGKIAEQSPARPHSTYGASKLAIDTYVQTRWREARVRAISLRQFNCLGERDVLHPYVVPEIYRQLKGEGTVYLGNNSFRDFMYAGDAVRIAVELLEKGHYGEVYNLGSQEGIQIYDLARMVGAIMGKPDVVIAEDMSRKRAWEIWSLQSDNSKINAVVEARPEVGLEEAVRRTVGWYECTNGIE